MDILAYPKQHPWITGIIVVVGGLVFLSITGVLGGGGSSSGSSDSSRLSDAELAAQAQIAAATIAAQGQAAQAGAQLQAAQIGAGVQMNSDKLASEVAMRNLEVQQALGLADTEANRQLGLAQIAGQVEGLRIQTQGQVETNRIIASGQRSSSRNSLLGSVVGGLFGMFSDERLKENITRVGTAKAGYGIYEFNYKGSPRKYRGVIAQEVRQYRPDWVIEDKRTGHLKTLPQALAA